MSTLAGRRIVVTRGREQSSRLVQLLEERGASVREIPAIEVTGPSDPRPLDEALGVLPRYDWIVFTSANAVGAVLRRLTVLGLEPRLSARGPKVASVGGATTAALRASFPEDPVVLQPEEFRGAALVASFARRGVEGARVLVPASNRAREELAGGLRSLGATVDVVTAYSMSEPPGLRSAVGDVLASGFDLALFASPSAVEAFAGAAGPRGSGLKVAVIGPTTEAAARAAGMDVRAVARPSTAEGLVAAAERALRPLEAPQP